VNDVDDMYKRLDRIDFLLEEHGLLHKKNYEMMLRRLTDNNDVTALKTLVDVIEPLQEYKRHREVDYLQHSPYTRVVDATRPESMTARKFAALVDSYLLTKGGAELTEIRHWLNKWKDNNAELQITMEASPIIREIEPLSFNLQNLSLVGLEALQLIKQNEKAPVSWIDKATAIIEMSGEPYGQVEIMVIEPIRKLVDYSAD
jgi:hexosaminidase